MFNVLSEIVFLIDSKSYDPKYNDAIKTSANNYYKQYKDSEFSEYVKEQYDKFLSVL